MAAPASWVFSRSTVLLVVMIGLSLQWVPSNGGTVRHYKFDVVMKNTTLLCSSKAIVTVNGKFPGPTLYAREGDNVLVRVINHVRYNVTIHWHGVRQLRSGWADGPAYITQCPIQPKQSYVYNFTITGQRGTLLWHAHVLWLRATVHGAIVILPKLHVPYPFPKPHREIILVLGEWWKADTEAVINQAMKTGLAPNVSDAHVINGYPGPLSYPCADHHSSQQDGFELRVKSGKTYLLRIINAALNEDLFFRVAAHNLTVVEVDAVYTKPFSTDTLLITPGQTTNVLLNADRAPARYLVTASTFMDTMTVAIDNRSATATVSYVNAGALSSAGANIISAIPPARNATPVATGFTESLRSLNSEVYPARVPQAVDHSLLFTMGLGVNPCSTCVNGSRVVGAVNNISFVMPTTALLQAHYLGIGGVFTADFPGNPAASYNYTGGGPANKGTTNGTRVYRVSHNSTVQLVMQDTGVIAPESHPVHLHGFNFFVVGRGLGNYIPDASPPPEKHFNLVDPIERNTIGVPTGGWTAIRFRADNPGVWFLHCHFEVHTTWGLKMAFLVDNGNGPTQSILPPPEDLPEC